MHITFYPPDDGKSEMWRARIYEYYPKTQSSHDHMYSCNVDKDGTVKKMEYLHSMYQEPSDFRFNDKSRTLVASAPKRVMVKDHPTIDIWPRIKDRKVLAVGVIAEKDWDPFKSEIQGTLRRFDR